MLTLIRCPFHPRVVTVARKRPRSFCKKCRWQFTPKHACTRNPPKSEWADYAAVQVECRNLSGNELTRNSLGNIRSQSSQLSDPLWTDPGPKSGISLRELISTFKKKRRRGMNSRTFSENPHTRRKSHHHHHHTPATLPRPVCPIGTLLIYTMHPSHPTPPRMPHWHAFDLYHAPQPPYPIPYAPLARF